MKENSSEGSTGSSSSADTMADAFLLVAIMNGSMCLVCVIVKSYRSAVENVMSCSDIKTAVFWLFLTQTLKDPGRVSIPFVLHDHDHLAPLFCDLQAVPIPFSEKGRVIPKARTLRSGLSAALN